MRLGLIRGLPTKPASLLGRTKKRVSTGERSDDTSTSVVQNNNRRADVQERHRRRREHSSRGHEHGVAADGNLVQRRVMMDSRNGEGLQYRMALDLPLEPTHKRRPAREFMGQGQNSQLQTELDINQATMVERKVPAYNRLKTDCVACPISLAADPHGRWCGSGGS